MGKYINVEGDRKPFYFLVVMVMVLAVLTVLFYKSLQSIDWNRADNDTEKTFSKIEPGIYELPYRVSTRSSDGNNVFIDLVVRYQVKDGKGLSERYRSREDLDNNIINLISGAVRKTTVSMLTVDSFSEEGQRRISERMMESLSIFNVGYISLLSVSSRVNYNDDTEELRKMLGKNGHVDEIKISEYEFPKEVYTQINESREKALEKKE